MSANRNAVLGGTLAAILLLVGLLWCFPRRSSLQPAAQAGPELVAAVSPAGEELQPSRAEPGAAMRVGLPSEPDPETAAEDLRPAIVTGFMAIDDVPQDGGRVLFRNEDGTWERVVPISYNGAFRIDGVPSSKLTLSFELPPQGERQLFVPRLEIRPKPGAVEDLNLLWWSTQVNVKVVGDEVNGSQAVVRVEGPGLVGLRLEGSIETSERGRASLSFVGTGRFTFTASQRSGQQGRAAVDVGGAEGLETVVITMGEDTVEESTQEIDVLATDVSHAAEDDAAEDDAVEAIR